MWESHLLYIEVFFLCLRPSDNISLCTDESLLFKARATLLSGFPSKKMEKIHTGMETGRTHYSQRGLLGAISVCHLTDPTFLKQNRKTEAPVVLRT